MLQGREFFLGGLALIRTLPTEPSEGGRMRLSAKVLRPVPCAEGRLLTRSRTVDCAEWASPDSDPHRGLCGPLCRTPLITARKNSGAVA